MRRPNCEPPRGATKEQANAHIEQWHPRSSEETIAVARELCKGCPITARCLEVAIEMTVGNTSRPVSGIWGGTTSIERGRARAKRNRRAVA